MYNKRVGCGQNLWLQQILLKYCSHLSHNLLRWWPNLDGGLHHCSLINGRNQNFQVYGNDHRHIIIQPQARMRMRFSTSLISKRCLKWFHISQIMLLHSKHLYHYVHPIWKKIIQADRKDKCKGSTPST